MVACLVLDVDVEVSLHGPHVLVAVAGGGQDLEADVAQCVQDHHRAEDDDGVGDVFIVQCCLGSLLSVPQRPSGRDDATETGSATCYSSN